MGGKRTRKGKHIHICITSLIFLSVLSCATLKGNEHLLRSQSLFAKGDYEAALQENQKVLSASPNRPPADEALFNMGLIYAHMKDYKKAFSYFWRVIKEFPQSPRAGEAKTWIEILNVIEKAKQVDIEIEEKKKELIR